MFKRSLSAVVLATVAASLLSACGSESAMTLSPEMPANQQVESLSFSGVKAEITKSLTARFKELDANKDKKITPEEYGVKSPEDFQAFRGLDDNKDGSVVLKEMLPNFLEKQVTAIKMMNAANSLFKQIDTSKDGFVQMSELNNSALVSTAFADNFKKYDKEKKIFIFRKSNSGKLSKSEFQNEYAHIAVNGKASIPAEPAPAPADPAQPADPATPAI